MWWLKKWWLLSSTPERTKTGEQNLLREIAWVKGDKERCRKKPSQIFCLTLAGTATLSCTWLPGYTAYPRQACTHTLCVPPNPNSPLRKWRRITSICATHAPLIENKALFVLYHSFTLSTLSGFCSLFSVCRVLLLLPSFVLSFFLLCQFAGSWNSVSLFYHNLERRSEQWMEKLKGRFGKSGHEGAKKIEADMTDTWQYFVFLDPSINCCCWRCALFIND